jgi:hypothetical protein
VTPCAEEEDRTGGISGSSVLLLPIGISLLTANLAGEDYIQQHFAGFIVDIFFLPLMGIRIDVFFSFLAAQIAPCALHDNLGAAIHSIGHPLVFAYDGTQNFIRSAMLAHSYMIITIINPQDCLNPLMFMGNTVPDVQDCLVRSTFLTFSPFEDQYTVVVLLHILPRMVAMVGFINP